TSTQSNLVQILEKPDYGQASDKFGNQAELDQIFRLHVGNHLKAALVWNRGGRLILIPVRSGFEAQRFLAHAPRDHLVQSNEGPTTDKQDVGRVYRCKFLVWMLAAALRGHVGNRSFKNLQQSLLHAFAGYIASNRRVLVLPPNLVNLIDIDDSCLGST